MSLPISGFTAVPNPQMLAFMAAQSFVMMMQAGEGWQYGKRKQSAMTNEEFNKQTPLTIMERQMSELKQAIPSIQRSMNNMTPMIKMIVEQYGDFAAEIVKAAPKFFENAQGGSTLGGDIDIVAKEFNELLGGPPSAATIKKVGSGPQFIAGAAAGTAWVDPFMASLTTFFNGLGRGIENFGPTRKTLEDAQDTPTDTFQNIKDLQDQINKGTVTVPERKINPASREANPWTARQLQKKAVVDSGLSPAATAAVNSFKANIDNAASQLKIYTDRMKIYNSLPSSHGAKSSGTRATLPLIQKWTAKLSALRIKFRSTYGYYY